MERPSPADRNSEPLDENEYSLRESLCRASVLMYRYKDLLVHVAFI